MRCKQNFWPKQKAPLSLKTLPFHAQSLGDASFTEENYSQVRKKKKFDIAFCPKLFYHMFILGSFISNFFFLLCVCFLIMMLVGFTWVWQILMVSWWGFSLGFKQWWPGYSLIVPFYMPCLRLFCIFVFRPMLYSFVLLIKGRKFTNWGFNNWILVDVLESDFGCSHLLLYVENKVVEEFSHFKLYLVSIFR